LLRSEGITISGTVIAAALLSSCAGFQPQRDAASAYLERAAIQSRGTLTVRVSVLSADESRQMFDADLYSKGIQPVWIEVENLGTEHAWYLPVGTDEEYFVPNEISWMFRGGRTSTARAEIEAYFRNSAMSRIVPAGETVSGFVFTHLTPGTKGVNVDLVGDDINLQAFTFYVDVPGLRADHRDVDPETLYTSGQVRNVTSVAELKTALANLPCCSVENNRDAPELILNLVVLSEIETFHHALIKGRWEEAPILQEGSSTMDDDYGKFFGGRIVKPMYVFDRVQDAVFRKTRPSVGESNQVNLWLAPLTFNDTPVWLGQTARTFGPKNSDGGPVQIEPNLDDARFFFLQNFLYSGSISEYGLLVGLEPVSFDDYELASEGTEYFTDGYRAVIRLSEQPVSYSDVEYVEWSD
jgi:hypothetical protein